MYTLFITCQGGFESFVKREVLRNGLQEITVNDRCVEGKADLKTLYKLLISNRFANRIYLKLAEETLTDFDRLFEVCKNISWEKYIPEKVEIITEATAIRSELSHLPSIQSITKKAIITSLTKNQFDNHWDENRGGKELHIHTIIKDDIAHVLLDITGAPLHKRGWRQLAGEAPIKENLAALLVALSGWRFKETFWDGFCGSGTLAIEAALLARNIAPGKNRHFAIENTKIHDTEKMQQAKEFLKSKEFSGGNYKIIASDSDTNIIQIAQENAKKAGVFEDIDFRVGDFKSVQKNLALPLTFVSNPPYGVRLDDENIDTLYGDIFDFLKKENVSGGVITSYEDAQKYIDSSLFKNRKLYNGNIESRFWYKKKS